MLQLVCTCLNVRLHIRGDGGPPPDTPDSRHPFFLKGVNLVTLDIGGIAIEQKFLTLTQVVGSWSVTQCRNCQLYTHAVNNIDNSVLASTSLIGDPTRIKALQQTETFSPVFRLVLPQSLYQHPNPSQNHTDFPEERSSHTEDALSDIQHQVTRFLRKAESQVESKIRSFTDQQQAALSLMQNRARHDRNTMVALIASLQENEPDDSVHQMGFEGAMLPEDRRDNREREEEFDDDILDEPNVSLPPLAPHPGKPPTAPMGVYGLASSMRGMQISSSVGIPRSRPQGNIRVAQSLDAEALFDMEDNVAPLTEHPRPPYHSDEDDTDDSNQDEGIHIPGGREGANVGGRDSANVDLLAKSAPVNVPAWGNVRPRVVREAVNIERPSNEQIAASIQALAQSVHSNSEDLFGELPRRRPAVTRGFFIE